MRRLLSELYNNKNLNSFSLFTVIIHHNKLMLNKNTPRIIAKKKIITIAS